MHAYRLVLAASAPCTAIRLIPLSALQKLYPALITHLADVLFGLPGLDQGRSHIEKLARGTA